MIIRFPFFLEQFISFEFRLRTAGRITRRIGADMTHHLLPCHWRSISATRYINRARRTAGAPSRAPRTNNNDNDLTGPSATQVRTRGKGRNGPDGSHCQRL